MGGSSTNKQYLNKYDKKHGRTLEAIFKISVQEAVEVWLSILSKRTWSNHRSGVRKLEELGLFDPLMALQAFALVNHQAVLVSHWSECRRQARVAGYISFKGFLYRNFRKSLIGDLGYKRLF